MLLALPLVAASYAWAAWQRRKALAQLGDPALVRRLVGPSAARRRRYQATLVVVATGLLALALAGPRYGTALREVEREGVDLVVVLDVSASMLADDVGPNRLERARNELRKLLNELSGDRVGLVLFAGDAFLQCPLTTDYGAVRLFLDAATPEAIPVPGSDVAGALERATDALTASASDGRARVVLVVSDGEAHSGDLDDAIARADAAGIVRFAAGVGTERGGRIPLSGGGFKRNGQGEVVVTQLEDASLRAVAEEGTYFHLGPGGGALTTLADRLATLDRAVLGRDRFESYAEQYAWPLAFALLLLLVEPLVPERRRTA